MGMGWLRILGSDPVGALPPLQEYDEHLVQQKIVKVIIRIMKAAKSGIESMDFMQSCGEMMDFLKMEPTVKHPVLPHFCTAGRQRLLAEKVEDGKAFFDLLTIEALDASAWTTSFSMTCRGR